MTFLTEADTPRRGNGPGRIRSSARADGQAMGGCGGSAATPRGRLGRFRSKRLAREPSRSRGVDFVSATATRRGPSRCRHLSGSARSVGGAEAQRRHGIAWADSGANGLRASHGDPVASTSSPPQPPGKDRRDVATCRVRRGVSAEAARRHGIAAADSGGNGLRASHGDPVASTSSPPRPPGKERRDVATRRVRRDVSKDWSWWGFIARAGGPGPGNRRRSGRRKGPLSDRRPLRRDG